MRKCARARSHANGKLRSGDVMVEIGKKQVDAMEPGEFFGALSVRHLRLLVFSRPDFEVQKKKAAKVREEQRLAIKKASIAPLRSPPCSARWRLVVFPLPMLCGISPLA